MKYGHTIRYTTFEGCKGTIQVSDCDTAEEAREKITDFAKLGGWTPPKWWQWWRRNDTKFVD